jgi:hypothetical protein
MSIHMQAPNKKPATFWLLFFLACFEVLSAVPYGLALFLDPTGTWVGMSTEMLVGSPFRDFRIPGFILLTVLGLGALGLALALHRKPAWSWAAKLNPCKRRHWTWTATIIYGLALMIWIATQVSMIGFSSWLQPFHFAIGVAFITLPLTPSLRAHLTTLTVAPQNHSP